jgi:predicted lipoprotein with Yx(FWY)xxD motif
MRKLALLLVPALVVLAASVVFAQGSPTVKTRQDPKLGTFLTDGAGKTLYIFKKDEPGKSTCIGDCAKEWPPFTASGTLTLPAGVGGKLDTIKRDDGTAQVAYNDMPLYYFDEDKQPGDVKGQGKDDFFVATVSTGTPAASPMASPAAGSAVTIKGFAFDPPQLTVAVGTTVTWTNQDGVAHTVTADKGEFDSGNLDSGKTFSFTFSKAGTFSYHCTIHPQMKATIVVT